MLRTWIVVLICFLSSSSATGQEINDGIPTSDAIKVMLVQEPISKASWPIWRQRFVDWYYDRLSRTRSLDDAIAAFVFQEAESTGGELPEYLREDGIAWHLLGRHLMVTPTDRARRLAEAESAFRRAIQLEPSFAGSHTSLASALIRQVLVLSKSQLERPHAAILEEAEQEIHLAKQMDERTNLAWALGMLAYARGQLPEAERHLQQAQQDFPNSVAAATLLARAVMAQQTRSAPWSDATAPLVERFEDDGELQTLHAVALSRDQKWEEALTHLDRADELDFDSRLVLGPNGAAEIRELARLMTPSFRAGNAALEKERFEEAERHFRTALRDRPDEVEYARAIAFSRVSQLRGPDPEGTAVRDIEPLIERFPQDGRLLTSYALALAAAQRYREAAETLNRARESGVDPNEELGVDLVERITELGRPSLTVRILYAAGIFVAVYAVIMLLMTAAGVCLALLTRSYSQSVPAVVKGRVIVSRRDRLVMKLYAVALILSLLLFYMAVPFVSAGVVLVTVALMYLALMVPFFPFHLMAVVAVMGCGIAIAVLKSLFANTSPETFGVRKMERECPQLIDTVRSVAEAVETDFVDQVYVAPGSEIGVHQQGRGPFGILGVKRRVLVLGFGSIQALTIGELKAILAHEYAHFTHRDTLYSRIVHQVTMSIREALRAMGEHLGSLNYVNPFFWFFYLYFKAYSTLSAGFFRTREYMADRMAASLYGRNAFVSALTKVATEAQLFEATAHQNIVAFLREGKAFTNVYEAFRAYREQQMTQSEREKLYADMLNEQPSLLASHPAFGERIAAIRDLPDLETSEPDPAAALFEDVEQIEQELTLYLTQYHYAYQQMAMAAARA